MGKKKDRVGEASARSGGKKRKRKGDEDEVNLGIESNRNLSVWHLSGSVRCNVFTGKTEKVE